MRRATTTLLGLGLGCLLLLQASHLAWSEHYDGLGPICRVSTTKPVVALSFDDGPDPVYTPQVLAMLRASGSHATFFPVGTQVAAYRDLVRTEITSGMEVGDHTSTHPHLPSLSVAEASQQANDARAALTAIGAKVVLFRAPYGEVTPDQLVVLAGDGFTVVHWSLALDHYVGGMGLAAVAAANRLASEAQPGDIILAHDSALLPQDGGGPRPAAMQALPLLVQRLQARGFKIETVGELLGTGPPVRATPQRWFWGSGFTCPRA